MKNIIDTVKTETSYQLFIENHPAAIMLIDNSTGRIVEANEAAVSFYGYNKTELTQKLISEINTYSKEDVLLEMQLAKRQRRNHFEFTHNVKGGKTKKVNVTSYPIIHEGNELLFSIITERFDNDATFSDDFELETFINTSNDAICIVNGADVRTSKIVYANASFADVVSLKKDAIINKAVSELFTDIDHQTIDESKYTGGQHTLSMNDDYKSNVHIHCMKLRISGKMYSLLKVKLIDYVPISDVSVTTSFLNAITVRYGNNVGYAIAIQFFSNMDQSIVVSDYIHFVYNHVVSIFKKKLMTFNISLNQSSVVIFTTDDLLKVSKAMNEIFSSIEFDREYSLYVKNFKIRVGVSEQGCASPALIESTKSSLSLFADSQYNQVIYSKHLESLDRSLKIKKDIGKAIINNEFVLYGQPIVDIKQEAVEGFEILIRWNHPTYGIVNPNEFINYAEITGQILNIDLWVIENSLNFIRNNRELIGDLKVHINLSSKSFESEDVFNLLTKYHVDGLLDNVILEITEASNAEVLTETFLKVKAMGLSFAIDDFGTGFSSFERLRTIGVDYIKIDKSFIKSLVENPNDILILRAILGMCESLNIDVVAEGVETIEQIEFLRSRNCNIIQGFIFSKPLDVQVLTNTLTEINQHIVSQIASFNDSSQSFNARFYNHGRIFIQDIDQRYNLINPNIQLAQKLSFDMKNINIMNFTDMIDSHEIQYFLDAINLVRLEQKVISVSTLVKAADGNEYQAFCALKQLENNTFRLYIEFVDDLVDDEANLLGLSQSYLESFNSAPVGIILLNQDYKVINVNEIAANIFENSINDSLNEKVEDLIHDDNPHLMTLLNDAYHKNYADAIIDHQFSNAVSKTCHWMINAIEDKKYKTKRFICTIRDVTERINLEREKEKISKALDQSRSGILMTDLEGNFEYINEALCEMTGYSKDEVIGQSTSILSSKEQNNEFYNHLWATIKAGNVWNGEFHNKKKDNSFYWCQTSIYPIIEDDQITGYLGIQHDVTHEKELADVNEDLKTRLFEQDRIASLGMLTSGIMHEINNPLAYIQGNIDYLRDIIGDTEGNLPSQFEDFSDTLDDVASGLEQIKSIADGLKRYIFKRDSDEPELLNLVTAVEEVLLITKNEYKYHANVSLHFDQHESYEVMGNGSKIKQVLMNLIINATHAIIRGESDSLGEIQVRLSADEASNTISIKDSGCGMSDEVRARIFEPFFTTKDKGIGTGLGLSITRQIIEEDHHGSISCASEIGVGTEFTIILPRS